MDRQQTLALFGQGRDAWNRWAERQLESRDGTQSWRIASIADFSGHQFEIPDSATSAANKSLQPLHETMPLAVQMLLDPYRTKNQNTEDSPVGGTQQPYIDFVGFIFPGDALFSHAQFLCGVSFSHTEFKGAAFFDRTAFLGPLVFPATIHEFLTFNEAKFMDEAHFPGLRLEEDNNPRPDRPFAFNKTVFKKTVSFSGSVFPTSRVMFREAVFEHDADFSNVCFNGLALFDWAIFKRRAMFYRTTYRSSIQFNDVAFEGDTGFDGAIFHGKAFFNAVRVSSFFGMAGAEFLQVPDFDQATFAQAPPLHNVKIELQRPPNFFIAAFKSTYNKNLENERCWRALRRLAVQSHDHISEQGFYRQELLARRGTSDRARNASFWLSVLYQIFSDYGRSLSRPLLWWVGTTLFFASIYAFCHPSTDRWFPSACVEGTGDARIAALGLSLHNSLPAISGLGDRLSRFYACLYGTRGRIQFVTALPYGVNGQITSMPVLPDVLRLLGVFQVLFSATMIFLFLLAVRNRFKIK